MRFLLCVLIAVAFAFANNDGCTETSTGINPPASGTDDIVLTMVNNWSLGSGKALGLDMFEGPGMYYVLGADNTNDYIQAWDATTCTPAGTLPLSASNGNCFGLAWNNDNDTDTDTYYTNDFSVTTLFYTEDFGVNWTTSANPAGSNGRGMDFDGTDYWMTNGDGGGLWRFQPGVGQQNLAIPEVPTLPSGLAVFPNGSDVGVAVTTYNTFNIYFYNWNGATLSYIGSAACPTACTSSLGLTYSETSGNFFWAFNSSGYRLGEFSFDLTSLERSSWASIKSSF